MRLLARKQASPSPAATGQRSAHPLPHPASSSVAAAMHLAAPRLQPRRRCGSCAQPAVCAAKAKPKPAPAKQGKGSKAAQPEGGKGKADKAAKPRGDAAPARTAPPAPPAPPAAAVLVAHPAAEALAALPALAAGPPLSPEQLLSFERDGHVALRGLLTAAEVSALAPGLHASLDARRVDALRTGVRVALGEAALVDDFGVPFDEAEELEAAMAEAGASVPFLQVFNGWRAGCASARRLACSARLVHAAAALLGVEPSRVRLYQDALFVKRPGDGHTSWHADLAMAPLDCNAFVTLWLPLAAVPARADGGTALDYASASHRDVALHYWGLDTSDLDGRFALADHGALAAGDVSAHHGWTLHGAPPPPPGTQGSRAAIAVSYFADGARLLEELGLGDGYDEDEESYAGWAAELGGGALAAHDAVPLALAVEPR